MSVFIGSLLTLATPLSTFWPFSPFVYMLVLRTLLGLSQGFTYVSLFCLMRNWAPPSGHSRLVAIITAGTEVGGIVAFSIGGILCESSFLGKYVLGSVFVWENFFRHVAAPVP